MKKVTKLNTSPELVRFVNDFVELELKIMEVPKDLDQAKVLLGEMWFKNIVGNSTNAPNAFHVISRIMNILYPDNCPAMGELRAAVSIPSSSATRIIDLLVQNGYCRRLTDSNDRRMVRVALTDTGRQNVEAVQWYASQHAEEMLSELDPDEKVTFIASVSKMSASLRKKALVKKSGDVS